MEENNSKREIVISENVKGWLENLGFLLLLLIVIGCVALFALAGITVDTNTGDYELSTNPSNYSIILQFSEGCGDISKYKVYTNYVNKTVYDGGLFGEDTTYIYFKGLKCGLNDECELIESVEMRITETCSYYKTWR